MIFGPQQHDKSVCLCMCLCGVRGPQLLDDPLSNSTENTRLSEVSPFKSLPLELGRSQELVLAEMHSLDNVSAVVEDTANVLCVHCAREVWITIVATIATCCADPLRRLMKRQKKCIRYKVQIQW